MPMNFVLQEKDGGAPIEKYVIERREKGKDQWQPVLPRILAMTTDLGFDSRERILMLPKPKVHAVV